VLLLGSNRPSDATDFTRSSSAAISAAGIGVKPVPIFSAWSSTVSESMPTTSDEIGRLAAYRIASSAEHTPFATNTPPADTLPPPRLFMPIAPMPRSASFGSTSCVLLRYQ
jgi:hypothetical protein